MEYKELLEYTVPFGDASFSVKAKVLGYNELHEWITKWRNVEKGDARSDDDVLTKIVEVGLTSDGKAITPDKLKEIDFRVVRGIVQGYLQESGVVPKEGEAEKKDSGSA